MNERPDYYEFDGIRLSLTENHVTHLSSGRIFYPSTTHRQFLIVLSRNAPNIVTYQNLYRDVWRSEHYNDSALRNIRETKRQLVNYLKANGVENPTITTDQGYALTCDVVRGYEEQFADKNVLEQNLEDQNGWLKILRSELPFILVAGLSYGSLFLISAVAEIAYQFDTYGNSALLSGIFLMLLNTAAFVLSCGIIEVRHQSGKNAIVPAVGLIFCSSVVSIIFATQFLPFEAITQTSYQTQPAFFAFSKNILFYYFPLTVVFLLLPFHIVTGRQTSPDQIDDRIILKPAWLFSIFTAALIFSALTTNYLVDRLNAENPYHPLFVGMIGLRFAVYFGLALTGWAWYALRSSKSS